MPNARQLDISTVFYIPFTADHQTIKIMTPPINCQAAKHH